MTVNNYPLLLKHSPGLTIAVFSFCLFVPFFFSNWSALLGWDQVTDWPLKNTPLLCLEKLLGYFCRMLWVIFHYDGKTLFNYFYSIRLNLRIREYSSAQFMLPLLPASSVNTSDPVQLAAVRDHVRRIMWWAVSLIQSTFLFPSFWHEFIFVSSFQRFSFQICAFLNVLWKSNQSFLFLSVTSGLHPPQFHWWKCVFIVESNTPASCSLLYLAQ